MSEKPIFNENSLGNEITRVWGEHGAHSEVYSMLRKQVAKLEKDRAALLSACEAAYTELNEIRARDCVPYTHQGIKASVDENYFSIVVDNLREAIALCRANEVKA